MNGSEVPSSADVSIDRRVWDGIAALQRPGQPDVLSKILRKYLDSSRELVAAMTEAVRAGDAAALHHAAHTLKSSSAMFGARRLAALCREGEELGRTAPLEARATLLSRVEEEYERVEAALIAELRMRGG